MGAFSASWFPGGVGLEYKDNDAEVPATVVERDGKFVDPVGGWDKEGRTYHVIYQQSVEIMQPKPREPKEELNVLLQSVRGKKHSAAVSPNQPT